MLESNSPDKVAKGLVDFRGQLATLEVHHKGYGHIFKPLIIVVVERVGKC